MTVDPTGASAPPPPKATRNYRYALAPTPLQMRLLGRAQRHSRRLWNIAVTAQMEAMAAVRHGRKERIVGRLAERYRRKRLVGMLAAKVRRYMTEQGLTEDAARRQIAAEQAGRQARYRRSLAAQYGLETAAARVPHIWPQAVGRLVSWGCLGHYQDAGQAWAVSGSGAPRRKRARDPAPLRVQIAAGSSWAAGPVVDLSAYGGQALSAVRCTFHRPLPAGAVPKQISVTVDAVGDWHLTIALDCPLTSVQRDLPATGLTCGINPGIQLRLTVVEGHSPAAGPRGYAIVRPPHRDARLARRAARLLRRLDRQSRARSPHCYDERGRWVRGQRPHEPSQAMLATRRVLSALSLHAANVRRDHYGKAALRILRGYDTVKLGTWRPADTRESPDRHNPAGAGIRRRATNRKAYAQAISLLVGRLKDVASLSRAPKTILEVPEAHTTRACPVCRELTGPAGIAGLQRRTWTCVQCGTEHERDLAAAWNIAQSTSDLGGAGPSRRKPRPVGPRATVTTPRPLSFSAPAATAGQPVEPQGSANTGSSPPTGQTRRKAVDDQGGAARPATQGASRESGRDDRDPGGARALQGSGAVPLRGDGAHRRTPGRQVRGQLSRARASPPPAQAHTDGPSQ